MRYFYIVLFVAGILLVLGLLVFLLVRLRLHLAVRKVRKSSMQVKAQKLDRALSPFGFYYEETDDTVGSGFDSWQREMGYCRGYDEAAPLMYMIFDCEPIYFDYDGNRYLLELWKGQYGCTTGAEIGLYINRSAGRADAPGDLFYECVSDEECIHMQFVLYKNGEEILKRKAVHWWLTGFVVGMHSEASELAMEVGIGFSNAAMCKAFCMGLLQAGYERKDFRVEQYRVYFRFDVPKSKQPEVVCGERCRERIMRKNRKSCRLYSKVTGAFYTTLDKITYIGYCFPFLYRTIIRIGIRTNKKKLQKYRKQMKRKW